MAYPNFNVTNGDRFTCTLGETPTVPNHTYGYGRLDVAAAVAMAQQPATLTVKATASRSTQLANQQLVLEDLLTGYRYEGLTNANGDFTFPRLYSGNYILSIKNGSAENRIQITLSASETKEVTLVIGSKFYLPLIHKE